MNEVVCFGINAKKFNRIIYGRNCIQRGINELFKNPQTCTYYINNLKGLSRKIYISFAKNSGFRFKEFYNLLVLKNNFLCIKIYSLKKIVPFTVKDMSFLIDKEEIVWEENITNKWKLINQCQNELKIITKTLFLINNKSTLSNKKTGYKLFQPKIW